jgi:hypothetical protein
VLLIPGGINVQETRSGISRHAHFGGGYGLEDCGYGARQRLRNYGERRNGSTAGNVQEWLRAGTTDALLIAAAYPQKLT